MRHPRIIIASISLAAAAAIGGGVTAAMRHLPCQHPARCQPARRGDRPHRAGDRRRQDRDHLATSQGLPLDHHLNDTAA